eukprot:13518657-Alexandrium_andersonii.AAC.1
MCIRDRSQRGRARQSSEGNPAHGSPVGACAGGRSADTRRKPGSQTRARRARQPQMRKPSGASARAQAWASARRDPRS